MNVSHPGKPKRVLFYRYLATYLVVLLLPFAVFGFIISNVYLRVIEDEVVRNRLGLLEDFRVKADVQVKSIVEISQEIAVSPHLRPDLLKGGSGEPAQNAVRELALYDFGNEFVMEILLVLRGQSLVYSSKGTYLDISIPTFHYRYATWSPDEILNLLHTTPLPVLRPVEEITTVGFPGLRALTYITPIPPRFSEPYGTLMFLIDEEAVRRASQGLVEYADSVLVVFDPGGKEIIRLSSKEEGLEPELPVLDAQSPSNFQIIDEQGSRWLSLRILSSETGLTYAALVPFASAMREVLDTRRLFLGGIGIIALLGSLIIFLFAYINYNPLKKLRSISEAIAGDQVQNLNAIDAAKATMMRISEITKTLNMRLDQSREAVRSHLLSLLFKGSVSDSQMILSRCAEVGILFPFPFFSVAVFLFKKIRLDTEMRPPELTSFIETGLSDTCHAYGREHLDQDRLIFLINSERDAQDMLKLRIQYLIQYLRDRNDLEVTVGLGDSHNALEQIGRSYIEASTALDYSLIEGPGKVILFRAIARFGTTSDIEYPHQQLAALESAIVNGRVEQIIEITKGLTDFVRSHRVTLFLGRCIAYDITNTILRTLTKINSHFSHSHTRLPNVDSILEFRSLEELTELVNQVAYDVCNFINANRNFHSVELLGEIKSFIDEHYWEQTFYVQTVADRFEMSLSNLSHFFKSQAAESISDYINRRRIERSKLLLHSDTKPQIKAIACSVGYNDVSSFIKRFKEIVGVTPGQFRRKGRNRVG